MCRTSRIALVSRILLALAIPLTASASDPAEFMRQLIEKCEGKVQPRVQNEFRTGLINKLENYLNLTVGDREGLEERLEKIVVDEMTARNLPASPKIESQTMRILLRAYGYADGQEYSDRMEAFAQVKPALAKDPYFIWLRLQGKGDPIEFFLSPLNTGGSANLKLSTALLRLRAELDPHFPPVSRGLVAVILGLNAREFMIREQLGTLKHSDGAAFDLATSASATQRAHDDIYKSIRSNSPDRLTISDYEKLKAFLNLHNPDVEILRRHCMAVDGYYAGKLPSQEIEFLIGEAARIRKDAGFSDKIVFNSKFLQMWPSIWGNGLDYDMVLLRHFYQPESQRAKIESQLRSLNLYLEIYEHSSNRSSLNDYYNSLVAREARRFPYLTHLTPN